MEKHNRHILLTFDLEEFDLPVEYGIKINEDEQMAMGKKGLDEINEILDYNSMNCTIFTTANFALRYPSQVAALSTDHEIASHTFFHSSFKRCDLKNSRQVLEDIVSKKVNGIR
ncbi:MAG: polysaccharide deacetylase family protein, partial [Ginsengibacter sp.]